ncbi:MAG TPA: hypothetical protein VK691_09200, partial [Solirubrobacteraceae bacterium]|nr:hypothetical protein [Solirubrobacteraceae bacterium]
PSVAETETSMLETVIEYGTGKAAAIGQFAAGKTGTTSNYGDAWFVGWDSKYTVAVWVGYPNKLIPMTTDFNGNPVLGGTFPALIWHEFMMSALGIEKERAEQAAAKVGAHGHTSTTTGRSEVSSTPSVTTPAQSTTPSSTGKANGKSSAPSAGGNEAGGGTGAGTPEHAAPSTPAPTQTPAQETPSAPASSTPATPAAPVTPSPTGGSAAP